MSHDKKDRKKALYLGWVLLIGFFIVLVLIFMPLFNGQNGLNYMDDLYNSISKGSAHYIPKMMIQEVVETKGKTVAVNFAMKSEQQAKEVEPLLTKSGATVSVSGTDVKIDGDLSAILANCLEDSEALYLNKGDDLKNKYGYDGKLVLFNWHAALTGMGKALTAQKKFAEAKYITVIKEKGVECAYNYYKVEAKSISSQAWIVIFSLVFYVIYTMWYGYAILYLFEGWGLNIGH